VSLVSDVFSDMIRQRLSDGRKPRRGLRRRLRASRVFAVAMAAVVLWAAGGLMSAAAALWRLAGH
jgi:hypothetical protein